jgi:hypothetical protein
VAKEATEGAIYRGKSRCGVVASCCNLSPTELRIDSRFWFGFVTTLSLILFLLLKPQMKLVPIDHMHEGAESRGRHECSVRAKITQAGEAWCVDG